MQFHKQFLGATLVALAAGLAGCGGGGGGDGTDVSVKPMPPVLPQGIWQKADRSLSVFVLPNERGGEAWAVIGGDSLLQVDALAVSGSGFAGTGSLLLTTAQAQPQSQTVSIASPRTSELSFARNQGAAETLAYGNQYDQVARLSDWAGRWVHRQTAAGATIVTTIEFDQGGALVGGSRTSGCTYTGGKVSLRSEAKSVVDVSLTEICGDGPARTTTQYTGIGSWAVVDGAVLPDSRMLVLKSDRLSVLQLTRQADVSSAE